jgi:hypothetical protein
LETILNIFTKVGDQALKRHQHLNFIVALKRHNWPKATPRSRNLLAVFELGRVGRLTMVAVSV